MKALPRLVLLASLMSLSSCSTSRWYDASFAPAPLETEIRAQADAGSQVRALVTILGIARKTGEVEVRLRLENLGTSPAVLIVQSLELVSADLEMFGPARIEPHEDRVVASGESLSVDASFPPPANKKIGDVNLRGLNLRWTLEFNGNKVTTGATFQRTEWHYWPDDYPRWSLGVGYSH